MTIFVETQRKKQLVIQKYNESIKIHLDERETSFVIRLHYKTVDGKVKKSTSGPLALNEIIDIDTFKAFKTGPDRSSPCILIYDVELTTVDDASRCIVQ